MNKEKETIEPEVVDETPKDKKEEKSGGFKGFFSNLKNSSLRF